MGLRLITPPAAAVTLAEAKLFLRVVDPDEESLIEGFVDAATGYVEQYLGRALMDQTWELVLDAFPSATPALDSLWWLPQPATSGGGAIRIPKPPLIEVVSVKYVDPTGNEQLVASSDYYVDNVTQPYGWVVPQGGSLSWPATLDAINSVTVRFRAGYLDQTNSPPSENIPRDIKSALLMAVGAFYENRQETIVGTIANKMPWGMAEILLRHRVDMSMA